LKLVTIGPDTAASAHQYENIRVMLVLSSPDLHAGHEIPVVANPHRRISSLPGRFASMM
jgi:hypothetical protein